MTIDFPDSPSAEQVFTSGDRSWIFQNSRWELVPTPNFLVELISGKGDLIVADSSSTVTGVSVGTNGHYLRANSSTSSGVDWAPVDLQQYATQDDVLAMVIALGG